MMSILNANISKFKTISDTDNPETVNLLDWLKDNTHRKQVMELRKVVGKEKFKALKKSLPGITPSGIFSYRAEENLIKHSGLIQFDIDAKDNPGDMAELKALIKKENPFVAYCALSTSGRGLWGLIPIQHPDKHRQHFQAIKKCFEKWGVTIDSAPQNVASFRFVSYDPDPYFNHDAKVFLYVIDKQNKPKVNPESKTAKKVDICIKKIVEQKIDITGNYPQWFNIGTALLSTFGEAGRDLFHQVSKFSPKYRPEDADRCYTAWQQAGSGVDIGTFFNVCKEHGITFAEHKENNKPQSNDQGYPESWDNVEPDENEPTLAQIARATLYKDLELSSIQEILNKSTQEKKELLESIQREKGTLLQKLKIIETLDLGKDAELDEIYSYEQQIRILDKCCALEHLINKELSKAKK